MANDISKIKTPDGVVHDLKDSRVPANAKFTDTNYYHTTGSWNGLTYTATANGGAGALALTLPTGTTSTTVALGNHTHTTSIAASTGTNQLTLALDGKYSLTAGGSSYIFTMPSSFLPINITGTNITEKASTWRPKTETTYQYLWGTAITRSGWNTDTGDINFYLSADSSNNTWLNMNIDGYIYSYRGFIGNLTGNVTGDLAGNASTATTATKLGSSTVGNAYLPIYLNGGSPTEVSGLGEAYLTWGGKNFSSSYGPIDAAMIGVLGANRFEMLKCGTINGVNQIDFLYSRDGGTSWTDYGYTATQKRQHFSLFAGGAGLTIGKRTASETKSVNDRARVIIHTQNNVYTTLNKFAIYVGTNGSGHCWVSIDICYQEKDYTVESNWRNVVNKQTISGWSGWNIINTSGITTYGNLVATQNGHIRFTFGADTAGSTSYNGLTISKIAAFGGVGWANPSTPAAYSLPFNYVADGETGWYTNFSGDSIRLNNTAVSLNGHTHTFASLTSKPTTISGYGITDALATRMSDSNQDPHTLIITKTGNQSSSTWVHVYGGYMPNMYAAGATSTAGNIVGYEVGVSSTARNCAYLGFHYWGPSSSSSNYLTLGLHSADHIITANGYRRVGINNTNPQYTLDVSGTINASSSIKVNGTSVSLEGHTHSYLPLSGGALTGDVTLATGKTIRPAAATNACSLGTASYPWNYVHTKGINITDAGEVSLPFEGDGFLKYDQDSRLYLDNTAYATAAHKHGMTSANDMIIGGSGGTPTRLAKGSNNTFLGINSSGNIAWGTPGGTNAGHTHTLKITTVQGTNVTDLQSNTTYKLVVGNASYQFKTPTDYTCLAEGTKILMADNSEKNIEDVVAGDIIMSYDPNTEKLCEAVIIDNIHTGRSDDYVNYYFDDGSFLSIFGKHCIYSADEGTARGVDYWEPGWKTIAADGKEVMYIGSENVHNAGRKRHFDLHSSNKLYFANGILNAQSLTLDYPMYKDEGLPEEFITALKADFDSSANLHTHQFDKKTGSILAPILKELKAQKKVMDDNKKRLADSDYLVAKFTEGLISAAEWLKAKAERAGWRSAVNKAEPLYAAAEERYNAFKAKYKAPNTKRERFNAAVARDNACLEALKAYYKSKNEVSK